MLKRFIPFSFLTLFSLCLMAQRPMFIPVDRSVIPDASRAACDNKAGTSTQTLHSLAQSNDKRYLCYKDKLVIKHNKDQILTSDPVPSTAAGVAYLYLTCNPTKAGVTIQDIASDACILKTPSGGTPPGFGFYVESGGNLKGDNEFENDGYWQTSYGSGKPFKLVFAPITFDAFDYTVSPPKPKYEGSPAGQCVNVNTANAFDVIYLNEIISNNINQGDKQGSFKVIGGLSEYDNTTSYTIDISLKSNNAIKGTISSGAAKHNGTVNFTAPQNGTYVVNIEDGKSCGTTFEMVLSSALDVLITNDTICNTPNAKGNLLIIPSGGTGGYTYTYQKTGGGAVKGPFPLLPTGTTINVDAGEYIITVTDATGATVVKNGLIVQASQVLSVNISKTDPSCPEVLNGNATANVVGGFPPYYYEWSNGEKGSNKQNITGIGVINGNVKYTVTVTDRFGCTNDASANLTINKMTITNINNSNATCYGAKDGQITFSVTGGNVPSGNYNFKWKSKEDPKFSLEYDAGGANFWAQNPGKYTVTITDNVGCTIVDTTMEIKASRTITLTKNLANAKCFNEANGSIAVQVTQAGQGSTSTGPVTFTWNPVPGAFPNSTAFTQTYNDVKAGMYKVTVNDAFKCIIIDSMKITQPAAALDITIKTQKSPTCTGKGVDGEIEVTATGGTPSYSYAWARGGTKLPNIVNKITNLIAGKYTVTVTDANGCSKTQEIELIDPPGPTVSAIEVKNVNCSTDNNGSIKVTAQGANAADVLTYKWSNGASTNEIFNLTPGQYVVTISDPKGCAIIRDTVVKSPAPLTLVGQPAITKPKCPASEDGSIEIQIAGGTPDYSCAWATASTNGTLTSSTTVIKITDLPVGVYDITITDQNNCPSLVIPLVNIAVPDIMTLSKNVTKIISCANSMVNDAEATYTVTAGNSASNQYFFSWAGQPNGLSTALNQPIIIDDLKAGWNTITVSDGFCTQIDSVFIGTPPAVGYDSTTLKVNPVNCFGGTNGSIVISGTGGEGPYSYSWVPNLGNNPAVNNLPAGDYIAIITDSKNCEFRTTITVPEPPDISIALDSVNSDSIRCFGGNTGKLTVNVSGGNDATPGSPKYAFAWSPNVSSSNIALNLTVNNYTVIATDSKGCSTSKTYSVKQPKEKISFIIDTIIPPICNGYLTNISILAASGGNGSQLKNYRFSIDDGAPINADGGEIPVGAGKHTVKVFDPEGCASEEQTIDISEPPAIRVYLGEDIELELGDSREINAVIEPTGIPIVKYNWSWSPNATPLTFSDSCKNACAQIIKPLTDGYYILQVESADGCLGIDTINLTIDRNRNVFIPNVFSPNVDGTNDFFEVFADDQSVEEITNFKVYDRWGTLVYQNPQPFKPSESRSNGNRWNGYYKDNPANLGVYVYLCEVKFVDGVVITFRGDVMLMR